MKGFLLDENLPRQLRFDLGYPSVQATEIGPSPTDTELWQYARDHELTIVSKDADFSDRIMLFSPPPWVVHVRFGNLRLSEFHQHLESLWPFVLDRLPEHKLICLYPKRVEAFSDTP